ncbi:hypothetical protein [Halocynthiibacter sp.]|uniref:hypothetical protein n=1 Tax=Halocynthiibacter sp. TaxID=1979210 RepID=UPI003C3383AA
MSKSHEASPSPGQNPLEKLPVIAANFIQWRQNFLQSYWGWFAFLAGLLVLAWIAASVGSSLAWALLFICFVAFVILRNHFKTQANERVLRLALPIICNTIGLEFDTNSNKGRGRVRSVLNSGLLAKESVYVNESISGKIGGALISFDAFYTYRTKRKDGEKKRIRGFNGYIFQIPAPKGSKSIVARPLHHLLGKRLLMRLKGRRTNTRGMPSIIKVKHGRNLAWFPKRDARDLEAGAFIERHIDRSLKALPNRAKIHGVIVRNGRLFIVCKGSSGYFRHSILLSSKTSIMRKFQIWVAQASTIIDLYHIWNTPKRRSDGDRAV